MAGGSRKLARAINNLRKYLEQAFNDDLRRKIIQLINRFNERLKDPNVGQIIARINEALAENGNINELINNLNRILESIESQEIRNIFSSLAQLLADANASNIVGNISNALASVSSINQLVTVAQELALPAKIYLYGATGAQVGTVILTVIQLFSSRKSDQNLEKLVQYAAQQTAVLIASLRHSAIMTIIARHTANHHNVDLGNDTDLVNISWQEAREILRNTFPISPNILSIMQIEVEKIINELYVDYKDNEEIESVLNRANLSALDSDDTLKYAIYYWGNRFSSKPDKPDFDRGAMNYALVKRLYDGAGSKSKVEQLMQNLTASLKEKGGNKLYYEIANSWEDGAQAFLVIAQHIPHLAVMALEQDINAVFEQNDIPLSWREPIAQMIQVFHSAINDIEQKWIGNQPLPQEAKQLIVLRAYLEFCKDTAKYFFAPYNLYRECIVNASKDVMWSAWNVVRHPINTVKDTVTLPYDMLVNRNDRRTQLVQATKAHPFRIASSTAITSAAFAAIGGAMPPSAPPPGGLGSLLPKLVRNTSNMYGIRTANLGSLASSVTRTTVATGTQSTGAVAGIVAGSSAINANNLSAASSQSNPVSPERVHDQQAKYNDKQVKVGNCSLNSLLTELVQQRDTGMTYDVIGEWWEKVEAQDKAVKRQETVPGTTMFFSRIPSDASRLTSAQQLQAANSKSCADKCRPTLQ